ncbi:MAG: TonB-dependent receptor [Bacteroidetes bacterium]|nr:TonB-dependent receptor [Bacteroidota bacterium]
MLCLFFVTVSISAYAQQTVTGKVVDEGGLPLPGVSVVIKGTTTGTVTGIDGDFSVPNVSSEARLVFSFVGMTSQEIAVGNQTSVNITLETSSIGLDEVIAVGYGTQKKANLTGSVAMVTAEQLENRPIIAAGQGLQGVIPNLNISIRNGDPTRTADFNVRGFESINGGSPLILIDGVPGNMDKINPNDIESVTVLKDAAAAAVYGARAAFGVILVATKRGQKGKMKVTLGSELSLTQPIFLIDPIEDPYESARAWNIAQVNTSGNVQYDDDALAGYKTYSDNPTFENAWKVVDGGLRHYGYTPFKDMTIADNSLQQKHDMTISGATEDAAYYVSFGYLDKEGWANLPKDKNYNYKRYNILMKADFKINDWLSMDEQISWSAEQKDNPHFYNWDVNINSMARVKPNSMATFPDLPYYVEQGDHDDYAQYIGMDFLSVNPIPYWEQGGRDTETKHRLLVKQGITLTPIKGLRVRGDFSYSTYNAARQDVQSKIVGIANTDLLNLTVGNGFSGDNFIRNWATYNQYYVMNAYAEYTYDELADHFIKAMVGYNQEWGRNTQFSGRANDLITPLIPDLGATTGVQQTWGGKSHVALRGVFYRLNYSYLDKYLIEANGRYDGTSRFPTDDRFGFFPSVSVGWRVSSEGFMEGASNWLDNLKIRASYGTLGNQLLGSNYYPYISTMGSGQSSYMFAGGKIPYVSAAGLVSPTLTWETVATRNIGLDFTALNQRLDFSFDYYIRDTKDMLMEVEYPSILGTSAPKSNAADLSTRGWEIATTWRDRIGQDWMYSLTVGVADNQSEITKYDNPTGALSEHYVGKQMGEFWGYVTEGIFQTDEEVAAHADQSNRGANWKAGDMKYKDLNGDGFINAGSNTLDDPGDRQIIGNNTARYSWGFTPDVQYKNWTLNLFFQGLFRDYLPGNGNWNAFYPFNAGHAEKWYLEESWSPDNPNAYFAKPGISTKDGKKNIHPQTRFVQDASYIRLRNVTLSYEVPEDWAAKAGMSRALLYLSGMNLWTGSKMHKPLYPEQTSTVTQEYYFEKLFTFGVKITF